MAMAIMDRTNVEDFQQYHNQPHATQTPKSRSRSLQPYAQSVESVDQDFFNDDHEQSVAGSARHSSDLDEAIFDNSSHHSSPGTSHHSDDDISVLSDSKYGVAEQQHSSSPYTPFKARSPFRNPSSVRAMQMDTTPPSHLTSPKSQRYIFTPSQNGTPRSVRSHNSAMCSPSKISPTKKSRKEYPLVLLHVTLLPIPVLYSPAVMQSVLPGYILENWKLLQEKATDTVLERGILIPHPKEDYDLLEERLLESLELKLPRILKCGHFHLEDEADVAGSEEDYDSDNDADICEDCGRRVRDGRFGSGTGNKRWDIKLYAANGLMRSGAWGAAWREMERVDVEILPWIDEDLKLELELRREEEERVLEPRQERAFQRPQVPPNMDDARMREIYGESPQPYIDGLQDETPISSSANQALDPRPHNPPHHDIPLQTLLRNYIYLASQDRRNLAIFLLTILVLFLAIASWKPSPPHLPSVHHPLSAGLDIAPLSVSAAVNSEDVPLGTAAPAEYTSYSSAPRLSRSPSSTPAQQHERETLLLEDDLEDV